MARVDHDAQYQRGRAEKDYRTEQCEFVFHRQNNFFGSGLLRSNQLGTRNFEPGTIDSVPPRQGLSVHVSLV